MLTVPLGTCQQSFGKRALIGAIDVKGHSYCPKCTQVGSEVVGNKYPKSFFFILQISARDSILAKLNLKLKCKGSWVIRSAEDVSRGIKQKWRKASSRLIRANGE